MADAPEQPTTFTVILRGQTFSISESHILFAPGNLFQKSFLGDFSEATTKVMHLDRNPATFPIILDYLSGYEVFPLTDEESKVAGIGDQKLMRYLKADAEYYGLDALALQAKERLENPFACKSKAKRDVEEVEKNRIARKREHELQVARLGKDAQICAALAAKQITYWQARELGVV